MSGPGWTCDVASLSCYRSDTLAAGSAYPPVTLTVSVAANAPGVGDQRRHGARRRHDLRRELLHRQWRAERHRPDHDHPVRPGGHPAGAARPAGAVGDQQPRRRLRPGRQRRQLHADRFQRGQRGPGRGAGHADRLAARRGHPGADVGPGLDLLAGPGDAARLGQPVRARADLLPDRPAGGRRLLPAGHADRRGGEQRPAVGDQHRLGVRRRELRCRHRHRPDHRCSSCPRWWSPARTPPAASRTPRSRRATARRPGTATPSRWPTTATARPAAR